MIHQKFFWIGRIAVLALALVFPISLFAQASPPGRINYQGILRDASGNPVNGSQTMTFRFYDDPTAGTLLWEEIYDNATQVTVDNGLFTVALGDPAHWNAGSETVFTDVFSKHTDVYLAVQVGTDPEMTPRIKVVSAPYAENGGALDGHDSTYFLDTSSTAQTKAEKLTLNGATDYGVEAYGPTAGGYFADLDDTGFAYVAYSDYGIGAFGNYTGGYFRDLDDSGYTYVGVGNYGIWAFGNTAGGYFEDLDNSGYANVGYSTYKIIGTGTVSFVQNHPYEKDRVIVYAAPEGDEVATYTRGTAKLINGEAHIKLGKTFQWVTNPDIGLTAHLTPHGEPIPLAVKSLSTKEMVVIGPKDGPQDITFDYLVYGLRIGFEESSIVQEKQQEAYIPSFKDHRERYATYPELRKYNALERFKKMEASVRGIDVNAIDLSRAKALKEAIHEYDPETDPPVDDRQREEEPEHTPPVAKPAPNQIAKPGTEAIAKAEASSKELIPSGDVEKKEQVPLARNEVVLSCFFASEKIEPGEVVVMDSLQEGYVVRAATEGDPMVIGIAAGSEYGCAPLGQDQNGDGGSPVLIPVITYGVASVKVDANYGAILRGDLLVSSPTPGYAMRAGNAIQGTVIGKALETLDIGTGIIKVLVMIR